MSRYRWDAKSESFLKLNERTGKWVKGRAKPKGFDFSKPMNFMPDIAEVVVHATEKPVLLTSRSQRAAYCRANGLREAGDFKPGEIQERRRKKIERERAEVIKRAGLRPEQVRPAGWMEFR